MRLKRTTALFLSFILLLCIGLFSASAMTSDVLQPKATYIQTTDARINVGALSTTVKGRVNGTIAVTSIRIRLELQKKTGTTYSTIKTWEETFDSNEAVKTESKLTSPLSTYRLKATFTVYTSSSSETKTVYAYDS